MLKIKDSVPLEKLKEFGFGFDVSLDDGKLYWWNYKIFIGEDRFIKQDDGINNFINNLDYSFNGNEIEVLYDLITAGLVEKC